MLKQDTPDIRSRSLYNDILRLKRRQKGPLLLSAREFLAYQEHFCIGESTRFLERLIKLSSGKPAVVVPEIDYQKLERLRVTAWAARPAIANKAADELLRMIKNSLPPLRRRVNRLLDDPLPIALYIAQQQFTWALFKGENKSGIDCRDLPKHYRFVNDIKWNSINQRINDTPQSNALRDAHEKFHISPEALRTGLIQGRRA